MIDIQFIRDKPEIVKIKSQQKGYSVDIDELLRLDADKRELLARVELLRQRRNEIASKLKGSRPDESTVNEGKQLKIELTEQESYLRQADEQLTVLLKKVPNMPLDEVPVGASEDENVVIKEWGEKPNFDFRPKSHAQLAEAKGWLDKERAAKVAGARFVYLKGDLVLLDWAINMFALSKLTDPLFITEILQKNNLSLNPKPFVAVQPPAVAKTGVYEATGRLNKEEQTYKLADDDLWLNASAEHVLAPMFLNETLAEADLPIRMVGYTTAFRREAGTYGKDTEGFFRLHQFNKLEMETFSTSNTSYSEHMFMIALQEYFMQVLELPYRVLEKCTADIGGPNAKGVDIDAWLPSQNTYRETHTADYITNYQTRRMNTRVKLANGQVEYAHTNDATAFSQRPLIAILENFQTSQGDVRVPKVLQPYLNGREII